MAVIKTTSLSFNQALADLEAHVKSKPNYDTYWKDFYASGAGQTILELIAGLAAYENFSIESARRDTYLQECRLRSSAVAVANNLGYSAGRGINPTYILTFTPTNSFAVSEFDTVGVYKSSHSIVARETKVITSGVPNTLLVTIGNVSTETLTVPSPDLQPFRFSSENVSDDYRLLLRGDVMPVSTAFGDLAKDMWVSITNPTGAMDVFYANTDTYVARVNDYRTGDALALQYIELDTALRGLDSNDLKLTDDVITTAVEVNEFEDPERLDAIRVNAPFSADAQHVIRGRQDFATFFSTVVPNLAHTALEDDEAAPYEHKLTYIKDDLELLTAGEIAIFDAELEKVRPFGVMPATIVDPVPVASVLTITIYLHDTYAVDAATIEDDVTDIWRDYIWKLAVDYTDGGFIATMENAAESNLDYIKTLRITTDLAAPLAWNEYSIPTYTTTLN